MEMSFKVVNDFSYHHNPSYLSLSSSPWLLQTSRKFWTRPVFLWPHGNIFLLLWVWEAGQEEPSANRTAFGMRGWRKWLYMYLQYLWAFFAPCLASSCLICTTASNFWINPAECEWLYSALGTSHCYCRWLVPEQHLRRSWVLKRTWLLVAKEGTHSHQEQADRSAVNLGTKIFSCPFERF